MLSYWEQTTLPTYGVIVVGSGLIGLSTAVEISLRRPGWKILLLERGLLPTGATTRNAGFACFGSLTEILADVRRLGREAALAQVERRFRGLHLLRQRLGDEPIGYEHHGGYELLLDGQMEALHELPSMNTWLRPIFKTEVFQVMKERGTQSAAAAMGFNARTVRAIVKNPFEGQLHSGRLMRTLLAMAREKGIEILTGASVASVDTVGDRAEVRVRHGVLPVEVPFRAAQVVVCANGLTGELLPDSGITPARGQVLVTAPLPDLPWRGCFHMDEGFVYFRNINSPEGQRVLLGGARNVAPSAEDTGDLAITQTIQGRLEQLLRDTLMPGKAPAIEHRWAGTMGFSADRLPIVKRVSGRVSVAFGCNGMGVALGSLIAQEAAALVVE
ncbi:MAG TPA: FAD-dependent oxidoreductase [Holophagaceae bacterium]|nr:FAD-dependent oxidoreductase [Holophagaceae bacterium]